MNIQTIMENLDNPNVQGMIRGSPELQRDIEEAKARALSAMKVAHPEGDPTAGTMVPVDRGIIGDFDDKSGGVLNLALSYTEPRAAAGIAVFGLGLVALPLIAKLHSVDDGLEVEKVGIREAVGFQYEHCKRTREDEDYEKPLSQDALENRLGPLDPSGLASEILLSEAEASEKGRCTDDEIGRLQQSVLRSRAAVRRLRRRSALAFMGLTPDASADEVNQKYKRLALEMHPDKGGDAEVFQQLQDMKGRLTKSIQEEEDEEEKRKAQEEEDSKKLPPTAKAKQLRREAHKETIKLWDAAREAEAEMFQDKRLLKGDAGPVLARLRAFVQQFSNRCRMLPHGNKAAAKEAYWQFKKDGLELIATAALMDPSATANIIATNVNYKIVSRSGSKEVAQDAQALITAIADVQQRVESFLVEMGRERAEALDAEDERTAEEERMGGSLSPNEEVLLVGEQAGEDAGERGVVLGSSGAGIAVRLDSGRRVVMPRVALRRAPPRPRPTDAGSDSTTASEASPPDAVSEVLRPQQAPQQAQQQAPQQAGPTVLAKAPEMQPAIADPERLEWDPDFTHPYVGAMDGAGAEIFCRACRRWIPTRKFAHEPFLRHARVVHKKPPQGWKGPVPKEEE
mmetsp:Transcript_65932/g.212672  ORF Transcript_65932/g.212672 Transcript_65932/m.212672 type:complete len:626 (-) Transcript_65932:45-1922(-)